MGGAGPYVTFDSSETNLFEWHIRTGINRKPEDVIRCWNLIREWLLDQKSTLTGQYGWEEAPVMGCWERFVDVPIFNIEPTPNLPNYEGFFALPEQLIARADHNAFGAHPVFDTGDAGAMKRQFENPRLFKGARYNRTWGISNTYIDSPEPLQNIFYILQCILPGLLTITREEDPDDQREFINSRGLPHPEWLQENHDFLEKIFDDYEYGKLYDAAKDRKKAYKCKYGPSPFEEEQVGKMVDDPLWDILRSFT